MADLTYREMTTEHLGDTATEDDLAVFAAACEAFQEQNDCTDLEATEYVWGNGDWCSSIENIPVYWYVL